MELPEELQNKAPCARELAKISQLHYRRRQLERSVQRYTKNRVINSTRIAKIGESHGFRLGGTEKPYNG